MALKFQTSTIAVAAAFASWTESNSGVIGARKKTPPLKKVALFNSGAKKNWSVSEKIDVLIAKPIKLINPNCAN